MTTQFGAREGVAVVLGASGGLGAAVTDLLAERSCRVAATFRTPGSAALAPVLERHGAAVSTYRLDLGDAAACEDFAAARTADGPIHTVVYAAGPHVPMVHLSRVSPEQMRAQLNDDVAAFFNAAVALLPALRQSAGNLVAITTAATSRFPVRDGLSSAPKAAVEALVRGLAAEEGRFGVRVNCVGPGMLTDGMAERLIASGDLDDAALAAARGNIPLRRFGSARDIAEAVCFLAGDGAGFITGQKLDVDGGYAV